jgi:hypothetical protein
LIEKLDDDEKRYEKTFTMKDSGKRFKVIVEHGELYIECIDSFEEIFEVGKEMIQNVEIINILDPYLF